MNIVVKCLAVTAILAGQAEAAPVTIDLTGTVTSSVSPLLPQGDPFSVSVTYNPSACPLQGNANCGDAITSATSTLGVSTVFSFPPAIPLNDPGIGCGSSWTSCMSVYTVNGSTEFQFDVLFAPRSGFEYLLLDALLINTHSTGLQNFPTSWSNASLNEFNIKTVEFESIANPADPNPNGAPPDYLGEGTVADKAATSAPEIDTNATASGLALLLSGLAVLRGRRARN